MYWADKVADKIIESGKFKPYLVDDMYTPSGFAHIGSLRGPLIHDFIFKALKHAGEKARFTYVINDFDPVDGLPEQFQEKFSEFLGFPLRNTPSPTEQYKTFADYFAGDLKETLKKLGVEPEYLSSWDMYHEGKFDEAIRIALDNTEKIQNIYHKISGSKKKQAGWLPLQVICQNCGRLGTTRVHDWDGETVAYKCETAMVKWAVGCGFEGRISPFGGNGKLPWKVDWPAHWMVLGVTIEGAGKDHSVAGSSRDVARELCQEVFKIEEPFNLPYEFLTIGGKKMSSSKGTGLKAHDLFTLLPAEVGRFLYCRTDYRQEVNFDPMGTNAIPDLFDEYDRCFMAYLTEGEEELARFFEMAHIGDLPTKGEMFLPRFRDVANFIRNASSDLVASFSQIKGSELTGAEKEILSEREKYAKAWIEDYAPEEFKISFSEELPGKVKDLSSEQKEFLTKIPELIEKATDPEKLHLDIYKLSQEMGLGGKLAFASIYTALNGKEFGPKAGQILMQLPKEKIIARFREASK